MPKIRFTQDRETVEATPQAFKAGQVYELTAASCDRWVRRGAAVFVSDDDTPPPATAPAQVVVAKEPAKPAAKAVGRRA